MNNLLSKSKASYYRDVIENSKHDQRVLFQTVNKLLHTVMAISWLYLNLESIVVTRHSGNST